MNKLFWVGCFPPENHSIGDHAQTLAVQEYLDKNFTDYEIKRFYRNDIFSFIKEKVNKEDLIFIQSSGDFGDLYPEWHNTRKLIIDLFPNNKIIQLPISVYYSRFSSFMEDREFFKGKPNLTLLCRNKNSTEFLKSYFKCKVRFFPDFTLYLKPKITNVKREGILFILRKDCESYLRNQIPKRFKHRFIKDILDYFLDLDFNRNIKKLKFYNRKNVFSDIHISNVDITDSNRKEVIKKVFSETQKYKYVITDRYHASIFAYLTNTPFKFLNGLVKKQDDIMFSDSSFYFEWFRGINGV